MHVYLVGQKTSVSERFQSNADNKSEDKEETRQEEDVSSVDTSVTNQSTSQSFAVMLRHSMPIKLRRI